MDRILADAKMSSQYAARYHGDLEAALHAYGRTADSLERPVSPAPPSGRAGNDSPMHGGRRRSPRDYSGPPVEKQHPLA